MAGWLSKWFGGQRRETQEVSGRRTHGLAHGLAAPPVAVPTSAAATTSEQAAARPPLLLCWLFDAPEPEPDLSDGERAALDAVDRVLARPGLPVDLLPRATSVVPQLLALLRHDDLHVDALADRIRHDRALAAEVLKQASSSFFSAGTPPADLAQAIHRLGVEGLQMAIARVVLRPLYQSQPGSITSMAGPRLWAHSDQLAQHTAQAAPALGVSRFDAYVSGLLHDIGLTVLLHALQRAGLSTLGRFSHEGAQALEHRAHTLFGRAAEAWPISPAFTALAADARAVSLEDSRLPLAVALRKAKPACLLDLAGSGPGQR